MLRKLGGFVPPFVFAAGLNKVLEYKDYSHLLEILENRKTELQKLGKESLEECFSLTKVTRTKTCNLVAIFSGGNPNH